MGGGGGRPPPPPPPPKAMLDPGRGGSRILGKGGSDKYIQNWGRVREGARPSRDSKGVLGER